MLVHGSFSLLYCMGMCVAEKGVYGFARGSHSLVSGSGGHLVHGGGKSPHRGRQRCYSSGLWYSMRSEISHSR